MDAQNRLATAMVRKDTMNLLAFMLACVTATRPSAPPDTAPDTGTPDAGEHEDTADSAPPTDDLDGDGRGQLRLGELSTTLGVLRRAPVRSA